MGKKLIFGALVSSFISCSVVFLPFGLVFLFPFFFFFFNISSEKSTSLVCLFGPPSSQYWKVISIHWKLHQLPTDDTYFLNRIDLCSIYVCTLYCKKKTYWVGADTEEGIARAIIRGVIDFERDPWPKVSEEVKETVRSMLDPNPYTRISLQEVLGTFIL